MRARFAGPSLVLAMCFLSGCAVGGDPQTAPEVRPRALAATPDPSPTPTDAAPAAAAPRATAMSSAEPAVTPKAFRKVASIADDTGDHGATGPGYADLDVVRMSADEARVRISVDVAGDLPARLTKGEVVGLGVDVGPKDYQLFADGGEDGWFAYLYTPKGFVAYPGRFTVRRRSITFDVPWSALGDQRRGELSVFCDWSKRVAVVNDAAEDHAPDTGATPYR